MRLLIEFCRIDLTASKAGETTRTRLLHVDSVPEKPGIVPAHVAVLVGCAVRSHTLLCLEEP
jgi:hypothetical protein